ncbi:MAG TPA: hypothetical protein VFT78_06725 [Hanamia sp.]|nr:hypothetical protein [Hanamia sp.]
MKKTDFQSDVISDTTNDLLKTLAIQFFPTQVVVKDGKVVKIFDDQYHALPDLKMMLRNEVEKQVYKK